MLYNYSNFNYSRISSHRTFWIYENQWSFFRKYIEVNVDDFSKCCYDNNILYYKSLKGLTYIELFWKEMDEIVHSSMSNTKGVPSFTLYFGKKCNITKIAKFRFINASRFLVNSPEELAYFWFSTCFQERMQTFRCKTILTDLPFTELIISWI